MRSKGSRPVASKCEPRESNAVTIIKNKGNFSRYRILTHGKENGILSQNVKKTIDFVEMNVEWRK
jgi:hypothetical protein